jgi:peptidoglycan/xylan/chitin deacetylase (PgdA/CDA1 family)
MIADTRICRYKNDKQAAYSLCADDSLDSQLDCMAPEMLKRGFVGTFWVNPGRGAVGEYGNCWIRREAEWLAVARAGFDFANHTMKHYGAKSLEEADREIRESRDVIWKSNPGQKLQLFLRGGGTTWDVSREEVNEILVKYDCVNGRGGGVSGPAWHDFAQVSATGEEFVRAVDQAIQTGAWYISAFHGVGPKAEWLKLDLDPFLVLLDYLYEKRPLLWVDTNTNIHKYTMEYANVTLDAPVRENGEIILRMDTTLRKDLYDYPLTLKTEVPFNWERCTVTQGSRKTAYSVRNGEVMFDALPNGEKIVLARM